MVELSSQPVHVHWVHLVANPLLAILSDGLFILRPDHKGETIPDECEMNVVLLLPGADYSSEWAVTLRIPMI